MALDLDSYACYEDFSAASGIPEEKTPPATTQNPQQKQPHQQQQAGGYQQMTLQQQQGPALTAEANAIFQSPLREKNPEDDAFCERLGTARTLDALLALGI